MTENEHNPDIMLERAVDVLRDARVPPGPEAAIRHQLVARLAATDRGLSSIEGEYVRRRMIMRRTGIAASLLAVAGVIGWLVVLGESPSSSAFAHMLQQVNEARTAVFETRATRGDSEMFRSKSFLLMPDRTREEFSEGEHRTVHIHNRKDRKWLTL